MDGAGRALILVYKRDRTARNHEGFEDIICRNCQVRQACRRGNTVGEDDIYADSVILSRPEDLDTDRLGQYSVRENAKTFHESIIRLAKIGDDLQLKGLSYGGRVLLIGGVGTDFEAFVQYLSREIPINIVRPRMERVLGRPDSIRESISFWFEFAKRNAPSILYLEKMEYIAPAQSRESALLGIEAEGTSWVNDEVLLVASTSSPQLMDAELLSVFNHTFVSESATLDDRVRLFEAAFKDREDLSPTDAAELSEGWSFSETQHLAVSLVLCQAQEEGQIPREKLEQMIADSGVLPVGRKRAFEDMVTRIQGLKVPSISPVETEYPDEFLDQLYLLAVGENYAETQRVIEALNSSLPLSSKDLEYLSEYPFLMKGTAEDRLTRLLRAKKSNDRLRRIMGR
jgi:SpoVK/Ycf46/Vps4 family AAA+-type ATPase